MALKKVTNYRLLFSHRLFEQPDIVEEKFEEIKKYIWGEADQPLKHTHNFKTFWHTLQCAYGMKEKNICCSSMKLVWQIAQLTPFGIQKCICHHAPGLFTSAFVSPKFSVCLPCFYIKGAPKHFLQHSTLLLGGVSIFCIFSRTPFGSFLSASLYSLSKTSEIEKAQLKLF